MKLEVLNKDGSKVSEIEPKEGLFEGVNADLFYETIKMQLANRRKGCASTKTKGEVSGGGRKPWKQKGTGRARAGSIRSPLWRHGGVVFGPHPRDYSYKIPKKAVKGTIRSAIAHKIGSGKLKIIDSFGISTPKTKSALEVLKSINLKNALIVISGEDRNLKLAVRGLKDYKLLNASAINVYDILNYDCLIMTKDAFEKIESMVGV